MQTFLPLADYRASASTLDRARLGKQRVEALMILRILVTGSTGGWSTHPAVHMWRGRAQSLAEYGIAVCDEWITLGYQDTCRAKMLLLMPDPGGPKPRWFGNEKFHASHRSNLLRKASWWYSQWDWPEPHDLPYIWPKP